MTTTHHVLLHTFGKVILSPALCCNNNSPRELNKKTEKALCSKPLGLFMLKVWASLLVDSSAKQSFSSTITSFSVAIKFNWPSLSALVVFDRESADVPTLIPRLLPLPLLLPLTLILVMKLLQPIRECECMKLCTQSLALIQKRFAHRKRRPYILVIEKILGGT